MKILTVAMLSAIALVIATPAWTGSGQLDGVKMKVIDSGHKLKQGKRHKARKEARRIINEYMVRQGDTTQTEIDAHEAKRKALKAELKGLRKAGDKETLRQRLKQLRQEQKIKHKKTRAYIDDHPELASLLKERRKELREQRKDG